MLRHHGPVFWIGLLRDASAAVLAIGSGIVVWRRKRSARHWPMTYGTVELGISTDLNNKWISDLSYSYKVGAEFYSGRIVLPAKSEGDADQQIRQWKGQVLTVRYSPKRPDISVIRAEDQQSWMGANLRVARI